MVQDVACLDCGIQIVILLRQLCLIQHILIWLNENCGCSPRNVLRYTVGILDNVNLEGHRSKQKSLRRKQRLG